MEKDALLQSQIGGISRTSTRPQRVNHILRMNKCANLSTYTSMLTDAWNLRCLQLDLDSKRTSSLQINSMYSFCYRIHNFNIIARSKLTNTVSENLTSNLTYVLVCPWNLEFNVCLGLSLKPHIQYKWLIQNNRYALRGGVSISTHKQKQVPVKLYMRHYFGDLSKWFNTFGIIKWN